MNRSDAEIIDAIEQNLFQIWMLLGKGPDREIVCTSRIIRLTSKHKSPFCNGVINAKLSDHRLDEEIGAILEHFSSRKLPMIWWVGPSSSPPRLRRRLKAHGLSDTGASIGMALELPQQLSPTRYPGELRIEIVSDQNGLDQWAEPFLQGFNIPQPGADFFLEAFARVGFDNSVQHFTGFKNNRPVCCASLLLTNHIAGIYNVATLLQERRSGLGTVITQFAIDQAHEFGAKLVVLHSTDMALGLYRRLGFHDYCRFEHYFWRCD